MGESLVGGATVALVDTPSDAPKPDLIPVDLTHVFDLEPHGADIWLGESPDYQWGRIYGGLVIAQSLWAAMQTVNPEHEVHSLHGYFILAGDPRQPVRYEVDRIRNGRSFTTRRVVARQSGGAIFSMSCSFQRYEGTIETQTATCPAGHRPPTSPVGLRENSGIDRLDETLAGNPPRSLMWARFPVDLGDDPRLHACALAYLSDNNPLDAVACAHPRGMPAPDEWHDTYMTASLDHAMWFLRPAQADQWHLFDMEGHGILRTRGLSTGHVFSDDGSHVATIAQEGLIREVKPD